jgi:hypothetical protein
MACGGPGVGTKGVLALATARRSIAAALVVGGKNFDDPRVLVRVVVVAVVGLLMLMPLARASWDRSMRKKQHRYRTLKIKARFRFAEPHCGA